MKKTPVSRSPSFPFSVSLSPLQCRVSLVRVSAEGTPEVGEVDVGLELLGRRPDKQVRVQTGHGRRFGPFTIY